MPAGRPKGSMNHKSRINLVAAKYDLLPLAHMLNVLNDEDEDSSARMDAAKSAAPYVHPKLANIEMNHDGGLEIVNRIERSIVKANSKDG